MKKILIYARESNLKPIGGPLGYLYNLKYEVEKNRVSNIEFIRSDINSSGYIKILNNMLRIIPNGILSVINTYRRFRKYRFLLSNKKKITDINLNDYAAIHFHSVVDMYSVKDSLENYKGKILLTSHSPKPTFLETYEDNINKFERTVLNKIYSNLYKIDEYSFNRADYILFPCEYAEEPYYNNWKKYEEIKKYKEECYKYIETGIKDCNKEGLNYIKEKEGLRKKYNIPEESFVVCYIGRHNKTKGYDRLKKIGESIIEKCDNVYFLIAGEEKPLKGLKHKQWIEMGWIDNPALPMIASDVFILPNKETYFDIIMLEALSLGKIIIASNTGGNKYFEKFSSEGIILYDDVEEAIKMIDRVKNLNKYEKKKIEDYNRRIFTENFTSDIFLKRYLELLKNLNII